MFREVSVVEAREVLRLWLRKYALREIARMLAIDRKTVRRYLQAAVDAGLDRSGDESQLGDELLGAVVGEIRTGRPAGHGEGWQRLEGERAFLAERFKEQLKLTKIHELLARRGVIVPYRTLHRFAVSELGFGRGRATVRLADGEPGAEVQVDFGRMGLVPDPRSDRRRVARRRRQVALFRTERLLKTLRAARLDASYEAEMRRLIAVDLLVLDDFALQAYDHQETADLYEIVVERHRRASTVVVSNREPNEWLAMMADPLLAQSAVDRLLNSAYELVLEGDSYRRHQKPTSEPADRRAEPLRGPQRPAAPAAGTLALPAGGAVHAKRRGRAGERGATKPQDGRK